MKKILYGIDAPPVITKLVLTGTLYLMIGIASYKLLVGHYSYTAVAVLITTLLFATPNFLFAVLMIWSSFFGKLIMRDKIISLLNLKGNEKVLDVGCGRGLLLIKIAKQLTRSGKAFGIDLWRSEDLSNNEELLTRENARLENVSDRINLISGDMTEMQFKNNEFDIIVSSLAIHNVPTREKRFEAIKEIDRTLKPGGQLVILDFQHTNDYLQFLKKLGWENIRLSCRYFTMFPPVRLITGVKSEP